MESIQIPQQFALFFHFFQILQLNVYYRQAVGDEVIQLKSTSKAPSWDDSWHKYSWESISLHVFKVFPQIEIERWHQLS